MASIKPANAGAVTRLLAKAGMRKSETHASGMVRGWSTTYEGVRSEQQMTYDRKRVRRGSYADGRPRFTYQSNNTSTGVVRVEYALGEAWHRKPSEDRVAKQRKHLDEARGILEAKGYHVEETVTKGILEVPFLLVSRRDEQGNVVTF